MQSIILLILLSTIYLQPAVGQPIENTEFQQLVNQVRYYEDNDNDSALFYLNILLKKAPNYVPERRMDVYFLAGEIYDNVSLLDLSLEYYSKVLAFDLLTESEQTRLYGELIELYSSLRDYETVDSLIIVTNRLIAVHNISESVLADVYYDYGTYYWYSGQYEKAIYYLRSTIELIKKDEPIDYGYMTYVASELSESYYRNGDLINAQAVLDSIYDYPGYQEFTLYAKGATSYAQGLVYLGKGDFDRSQQLLEGVLQTADEIGLIEEKANILGSLITLAEKKGDYELAFEYLSQKRAAEIEMLDIIKQRRLQVLEAQYELNQKDQLLQLQNLQIESRNQVIIGVGISAAVLLALTFFLFRLNRKNKLYQKELLQRNQQIETLMRELHHRVKNNLQVISSLLGLQSMQLTDSNAKAAVEESKGRVRTMSLIHQMLYRQDDITYVNIKTYIEELVKEVVSIFGYGDRLNLTLDIEEEEWDIDTALPLGMIVNELVMNAMKHAFESVDEPSLHISIKSDSAHIGLVVKDNGHMKVSIGDIENSTNFGQRLIRLLVEQMKGQMKVDYEDGLVYEIKMNKVA